ncbi:MAG TPA: ribosome maturation factor RimM [Acidimicrobiales bacterium]|nr:ribosome maturation factor RimM [Acidimicrobiales bacterium]
MLEVGTIAKAHGLKGEVIVRMTSNRPEQRLAAGARLSTATGELEVVWSSPHQHRWIVQFAGVSDRSAAEALHGTTLLAEPLEEEGALWIHELIGAQVVDAVGRRFGPVVAVEANPASDLLVLHGDRLVPLTFVVETRPDGVLVIDPPRGLVDEDIVFLVPPDPGWPAHFEAEAERLREALGEVAVDIHHYGSTSVPGLAAKPIIDILVTVAALEPMAPYKEPLEALGYEYVPHPENVDMPFFGWPAERPRAFNMHVVEAGGEQERLSLGFRDRLRADPGTAAAYADLKAVLVRQFREKREAYTNAKTAFIDEVLLRAAGETRP